MDRTRRTRGGVPVSRVFPQAPARRPTLSHRLEYAGLRLFLGVGRIGPGGWGTGWTRILADIAFDLVRLRRRVTLDNLRRAFPDRSEGERVAIARRTYRNFARTFLEAATLERIDPSDVRRQFDIQGMEHLDSARARGRGGILISAHFGNWEYMGGALALHGYPVSFLVRSQKNPLVDARINANRRRMGVGIIPVGQAVRRIYRELRANAFVAFLADQDAGRDGLFLDFLGRPASVVVGPAVFARRTGAAIIPGHSYRRPGGGFVLEIEPPIFPDESLPAEDDVRRLAEAYTRRSEAAIRRRPDHWFWMHRRWKTRPPADGGRGAVAQKGRSDADALAQLLP
ncbi:MAG: hypothetical protein GF355_13655 [Candidatus Eisenbacteria bacterium]|nr:hypothetical protein [Candidatus Eisenbacteria bacterium]